MWTRLVAGTAAHDVNNLAQGLLNLLALAEDPGATRELIAQYAELARGGLAELKRLGTDLRALADARVDEPAQRVDLACSDALVEVEPPAGRRLEAGALAPQLLVRASAAGLRLGISALLQHALAASAPGTAVSLAAARDGDGVAVVVDAPGAPALRAAGPSPVSSLLVGPERELSGGRLVFAGALAAQLGGELSVRSGAGGGQVFRLWLPAA
jgi:signal transduction histidine kinase